MNAGAAEQNIDLSLVTSVAYDGRRFGFRLRYVRGIQGALRQHAKWCAPERMWVVMAYRKHLQAFLDALGKVMLPRGLTFDVEDVSTRVMSAMQSPQPDVFVRHIGARMFPLLDGDWIFESAFDVHIPPALRVMGGSWDENHRHWRLPRADAAAYTHGISARTGLRDTDIYVHDEPLDYQTLIDSLDRHKGLSLSQAILDPRGLLAEDGGDNEQGEDVYDPSMDRDTLIEIPGIAAFETWTVDEDALAKIAAQMSLREHQVIGARFAGSRRSSLLADGMSVGKTRQSLAASMLVPGHITAVVAGPSHVFNWKKAIETLALAQAKVITSVEEMEAGCTFYVFTYDAMGALADQGFKADKLIIDEAHKLKDLATIRTQNALRLGANASWVCLLSGTVLVNQMLDIYPLLKISGHPLGQMSAERFLAEFSGSTILRRRLRRCLEQWMIRRLRKDVGEALPPLDRDECAIAVEPEALADYEAIAAAGGSSFALIHGLRREIERLKIDWVSTKLSGMGPDDKVILFCWYEESVEEYEEICRALGLRPVTMTGRHTARRRSAAQDAFQNDRSTRAFITTTSCGGEAVDLFAGNLVIFTCLPWTDAMLQQAIMRAHRDGQLRSVTALIPVLNGTIDTDLLSIVHRKRALAQDFYQGDGSVVAARDDEALRAAERETMSELSAILRGKRNAAATLSA